MPEWDSDEDSTPLPGVLSQQADALAISEKTGFFDAASATASAGR